MSGAVMLTCLKASYVMAGLYNVLKTHLIQIMKVASSQQVEALGHYHAVPRMPTSAT